MFKKLICLLSLIIVLAVAGSASADLILHWKLDEGSGTAAHDASGNGHDGAFDKAPKWTGGKIGGGVELGGTGDRIVDNAGADYLNGLSALTIAVWIKSDVAPTDKGFIEGEDPDGNDNVCTIRYDAAGASFGGVAVLKMAVTSNPGGEQQLESSANAQTTEWQHVAMTWESGGLIRLYLDGEEDTPTGRNGPNNAGTVSGCTKFVVGQGGKDASGGWDGKVDDVRIYNEALTAERIQGIMKGEGFPFAFGPTPADGGLHEDTWVNLSWSAGDFAVSHDVYLGDSFDAVEAAARDSEYFRGNQIATFYVAGFPGFAYPDGLVPGTTYYWRIDEVNDAEPNSPWAGPVWSFSIPPKAAYNPVPADGAENVDVASVLKWTPGFGAKLHTVYFGDDFDTVSNAAGGFPQGLASYKPAKIDPEKVYYWRVDEFDGVATYKGDVWGFTTPGAAGSPQPANGATGVAMISTLGWTPAAAAVSHDLYFGTDKDAVTNATTASPEYKGNKALGAESFDPGKLAWNSSYYWRVDAVYNAGPVKGLVWSFTTADFISVDDFEAYNDIDPPDAASNRIFDSWIDGFGTSNNGALVGNDLPPYAEQTIVHGGGQSMPYAYDNANKTSEATLTLSYPRDWTEEGVGELSLWFRGASANSAERMYVALNGSAVVYNDNDAATQTSGWTQWVIDLQAFADQGVNLAGVNTITLGVGTKNSPAAGGTGTLYFDDISLYRPAP